MKKLLTYSFTALLLIVSCRKGDNSRIPASARVPAPLITVDPSGDPTIAVQTADSFNGKFKVALYFPDTKPQKFDIVVIKNNDITNIKTIDANVTTFPSTFTITGAQLHTLFGAAIALGDSFTIGANITAQDGTVYPAFPAVGAAYGSGILAQPGFSPTITFSAVCKFNMTDYGAIGSSVPYVVVQDGWADYNPGQVIPVTIIDATHLSFFYGTDVNPKPIIITVNPVNNTTSVAAQTFGGYSSLASYGTFSTSSVAGNSANAVLPCSVDVSVDLNFTSPAGSFGTGVIELKRQ
jgi:hypothetical protein